MSAQTWLAWQIYAQLDPFDGARADMRAGIIASTIANIHRDPKRRKQPYTPKDFTPDYLKPPPEKQTPEEQLAIMRMWKAALGQSRSSD